MARFGHGISELGYGASLLVQSGYFLLFGRLRHQPVRLPSVIEQMMEIGIRALPIATVLSFVIGVLLGTMAGYYYTRWPDKVFSWVVNLIIAVPFLLIMVSILSFTTPSITKSYAILAG